MHEEADGGVGEHLAEQGRHEQQVVVVYPDEVARTVHVADAARERLVHRAVRCPVHVGARVLGRNILPEQVVEERPQC